MHSQYISRLEHVDTMCNGNTDLRKLMEDEVEQLKEDQTLIQANGTKVKHEYEDKLETGTTTNKKLKELCWSVHDHEVVADNIQDALDTFNSFIGQLDKVCLFLS